VAAGTGCGLSSVPEERFPSQFAALLRDLVACRLSRRRISSS